jgi:hypothetical protein
LFDDVPYEKMESLEWPVLKASVGKTKRMSSGYQLFYRITSTPQNPVSSSVSISAAISCLHAQAPDTLQVQCAGAASTLTMPLSPCHALVPAFHLKPHGPHSLTTAIWVSCVPFSLGCHNKTQTGYC